MLVRLRLLRNICFVYRISVSQYDTDSSIVNPDWQCVTDSTFCGLVNGIMITKFKVVPMIATLAMLTMARGMAYVVTMDNRFMDCLRTLLGWAPVES